MLLRIHDRPARRAGTAARGRFCAAFLCHLLIWILMAFSRSTSFNRSVKIRGSKTESLTSDGGVLMGREVLEDLKIVDRIADNITDTRDPKRSKFGVKELLYQMLLMLGQGWGHQSESRAMRNDPAMRAATASGRGAAAVTNGPGLASQSTISRMLGMLSMESNLAVLDRMLTVFGLEHLLTRNGGQRYESLVIDVDATPIETYGHQEGTAYNGHHGQTMYQALMAIIGEMGDVVAAKLCHGSRHMLRYAADFIVPMVQRVREHAADHVIIRMDAGFNSGELCQALEEEGIDYVMRLKRNDVLKRMAEPHLEDGHSTEYQYVELEYKAKKWDRPRRVVLVIPPHGPTLYPTYYFIVTSLSKEEYPAAALRALYAQRGNAERHIGEMKSVCPLALSSSSRRWQHSEPALTDGDVAVRNAALFLLNMLVYMLLHVQRTVLQVPGKAGVSVATFQKQYLKVGMRLIRRARYLIFMLASSAVARWDKFWKRYAAMEWVALPALQ